MAKSATGPPNPAAMPLARPTVTPCRFGRDVGGHRSGGLLDVQHSLTKQSPCQVDELAMTGHLGESERLRWVISGPVRLTSGPPKKAVNGRGEQKLGFRNQNAQVRVVLKESRNKKRGRMQKMTRSTHLPKGHRRLTGVSHHDPSCADQPGRVSRLAVYDCAECGCISRRRKRPYFNSPVDVPTSQVDRS